MIPRIIPTLTPADWDRFQTKVRVNAAGCHEWQGSLNPAGYGSFSVGGSSYPAHRVAYVHTHGEPAPGAVIDHACRNRRCVNPSHTRPLTAAENTAIGYAGRRGRLKILCPRGHALSGANLIASLTWAGRACRSCDVAARGARHRGLTGLERERFILERAAAKYAQLMEATPAA